MEPNYIEAKLYTPTPGEASESDSYLQHVLDNSANKNGIAVVRPLGGLMKDKSKLYALEKKTIKNSWYQEVVCIGRHFMLIGKDKEKPIKVSDYKELQKGEPYSGMTGLSVEQKEEHFWGHLGVSGRSSLYGLEQNGSLFSPNEEGINPNQLGTILSRLNLIGASVQGVTLPMYYLGLAGNSFGMHVEDKNLPSLNALVKVEDPVDNNSGGKIWYGTRPRDYNRVRSLLRTLLPREYAKCRSFIYHKDLLINPKHFIEAGIPLVRVHQKEGDILVIASKCFHWGFNLSYVVNESVNFGTLEWLPHGLLCGACECGAKPPVDIKVECLAEHFWPELLDHSHWKFTGPQPGSSSSGTSNMSSSTASAELSVANNSRKAVGHSSSKNELHLACPDCDMVYNKRSAFNKHKETHLKLACRCKKEFTRKSALDRHIKFICRE